MQGGSTRISEVGSRTTREDLSAEVSPWFMSSVAPDLLKGVNYVELALFPTLCSLIYSNLK